MGFSDNVHFFKKFLLSLLAEPSVAIARDSGHFNTPFTRRIHLRTSLFSQNRLLLNCLPVEKCGELNTLSELLTEWGWVLLEVSQKLTHPNLLIISDIRHEKLPLERAFSGWHTPCI